MSGQVAATIEASSSEAAVHWSEFITQFFGFSLFCRGLSFNKTPKVSGSIWTPKATCRLEWIWKIWKADFWETKLICFVRVHSHPSRWLYGTVLREIRGNRHWSSRLRKELLFPEEDVTQCAAVSSKESRKLSAVSKFLSFRWKDVHFRCCLYTTSGTSIICCPKRYACDGRRMCLSAPSMSENPRYKVVPSVW